MYEEYFGLRERPFELAPDPRYLLMTDRHREALSLLKYGISARKSITMLIGPPGTGKTTLIRAALSALSDSSAVCGCLTNPALTRRELLQSLAREFQLSETAGRSKAVFLAECKALLTERRRADFVTALIVDEAQALPDECLEEIRLLVNLESDEDRLLPIVLVGQRELATRLNQPEHVALKQRVALRCELQALTVSETAQYLVTRIRAAGGVPTHLFTREAVSLIHERSHGVPRTISVVCDNALVTGFALDQRPVGRQVILDVCRDLDLPASSDASSPSAVERPTVPARRAAGESAPAHLPPAAVVADSSSSELFGIFRRPDRSWFSR
jgi:general secretion pathway protein A